MFAPLISLRSLFLTFALTGTFLLGCSDGSVGGACRNKNDCPGNECCETKECGGGMCTYKCRNDQECPNGTACEHDRCFVRCIEKFDCLVGQSCTKNGVCEFD